MMIMTLLAGTAIALPVTPASASVVLCAGKVATITGTSGKETLHGTPGDDVIAGLGGGDWILGGAGDDIICGGDGADRLRGEEGDDVLLAGKAMWVDNRAGSGYRPDWLDGGPGDDTLDIGQEPVDRGDGISGVITFDSAPAGVVVDLAERTAVGDGQDTIVPRGGLRLVGTPADDSLSGSDLDEEINGMAGADRIVGRGGDDHLYGDAEGESAGPDGVDDDWISGGAGKDVLIGSAGADILRGGPGIDLVEANGAGPNQVLGGGGDDFLHLMLGTGDGVKLLGGAGRDDVTIDVHPTAPGPGKVLVNLGIEQLALDNVFVGRISGTERLHMGADVPLSFYGSPGPDEVYAEGGGRLRAWTYDGDDVIYGSSLADRIDGGVRPRRGARRSWPRHLSPRRAAPGLRAALAGLAQLSP